MSAYLINNGELSDPEGYEEYKAKAEKVVAAFGGRYLARDGESEALSGEWFPRFVIVEFPTYEQARAFYYSEEYQSLGQISARTTTASGTAIVDGLPEGVDH